VLATNAERHDPPITTFQAVELARLARREAVRRPRWSL
jgi:hypothetical protein